MRASVPALGWFLVVALFLRVTLDVFWWVPFPIEGVNLPRALGLSVTAVLFVACAAVLPSLRTFPLRWPFALFGGLLLLGLLRAPDPLQALGLGVRYASPLLLAIAAWRWLGGRRGAPLLLLGLGLAALVPLGISGEHLLAGRWHEPLHGYPRLVGWYRNPHSAGIALALFGTVGLYGALAPVRARWRLAGGALLLVTSVLLYTTYVRTGLVLLVVTAATLLVLERRWRGLGLLLGILVLAFAASPALRDRFLDLWRLLTWTPPAEGWIHLGTGRFAIWSRSFSAFLEEGWQSVVLGLGLGGHQHFWKGRDPHNEYLVLWYQLGIPGVVAFVGLLGAALAQALRRARQATDAGSRLLAHHAAALCVAVAVVSFLSNAFLSRLTLSWPFWCLVGAILALPPRGPDVPPDPS